MFVQIKFKISPDMLAVKWSISSETSLSHVCRTCTSSSGRLTGMVRLCHCYQLLHAGCECYVLFMHGDHSSWKVMEFSKTIFQPWKVMENSQGHGKSWKMMMMSWNFL